jgi:ubiquinone/menaquinone biosynthesis C-methylase UbiE
MKNKIYLNLNIVEKDQGDAFYLRNKLLLNNSKLEDRTSNSRIIKCFEITKILPKNILEIGCSAGLSLKFYKDYFKSKKINSKIYGIDLSKKAINNAKKKYKDISFSNISSLQIKKLNIKFNLIICGFFLYLLDRELLFKQFDIIYESLTEDGYLIIDDFDPLFPQYNTSYHKKKFYSFKANYSNFLTSSNLFKLIYLDKWDSKNNINKNNSKTFLSNEHSISLFKKIDFKNKFPFEV